MDYNTLDDVLDEDCSTDLELPADEEFAGVDEE